MSFSSFGSNFDGVNIGYEAPQAQNLFSGNDHAVLYVFPPKQGQVSDMALRPLQYNFDDNFFGQAQEISSQALRGTNRSSVLVESLMRQGNLNDQMIVNMTPTFTMRTSLLSEKWRFLLILTEQNKPMGMGTFASTLSPSSNRYIYTGFFEDEPFNPLTFGASRTLNENCFMVITHKSLVSANTRMGRFGSESFVNTMQSDSIVHAGLTRDLVADNISSRGLQLMTPDNCVTSSEQSSDGFTYASYGKSSLINDNGAVAVQGKFEQPAQNVRGVLEGILLNQEETNQRKSISVYHRNEILDDYTEDTLRRNSLSSFLQGRTSPLVSKFDLDVNSRISSADLDKMVNGTLTVVPIDMQKPMFYDTADTTESSMVNQYSSLIGTVVPQIISFAGLNSLQFRYDAMVMNGVTQDQFFIERAEGIYQMTPDEIRQRVAAVQFELSRGIFDVILRAVGAFSVLIKVDVSGMTQIRLSLIDQGKTNFADFEIPSFAGGIITPMIGDDVLMAGNSQSIETLYGIATGTLESGRPFGDRDLEFKGLIEESLSGEDNWD